ncbi:hypothetical protein AALC75_15290 [Lachnospiraceae bacterium 48-42]
MSRNIVASFLVPAGRYQSFLPYSRHILKNRALQNVCQTNVKAHWQVDCSVPFAFYYKGGVAYV